MWDKIDRIDSKETSVAKYVFSKPNAVVESVLYKYPDYETRTVICCSTQSGCPVGCRFCGTGDFFVRNLTAEEIVSQPARLLADTGVDPDDIKRLQIMVMSMGEPLLNLKNLERAFDEMYIRWPNARLLISTIGPHIDWARVRRMSCKIPTIGLQFSIHESTDEARNKLIPFKNKLTLEQISAEGTRWFDSTGRKPFFNYCVHDDNNTDADAERLFALFDPAVWCATISVICERNEGMPARNEHQLNLAMDFQTKLIERGFDTRVFDPAGQDDIGGGCGQLWFVQQWMKTHPEHARKSVGHGLPTVHTPCVV